MIPTFAVPTAVSVRPRRRLFSRLRKKHGVLLLALAAGVTFRLWNLPAQVLGEDEMHAVHAALAYPISRILTTYQRVDNSIPLTALYRFLMDRGAKLTEMMVRLPVLLSGIALLFLAPFWVARRLGWGSALIFAAVLAVSPGLVFYSRIGRSYGPIVLFAFGALIAFESWWRRPEDWRWGAVYVLLAALAVWLHLGAAPFVVSPFLFAVGDLLVRKSFRRLKSLLFLGLVTLAVFLSFLFPARKSLISLVRGKHEALHLTKRLVLSVLQLHSGSGEWWVAILFWLAVVVGLVRLFHLDSRLAALSVTTVLGQLVGLLCLAPVGHDDPPIFFRYMLVDLPWLSLWVAALVGFRPPDRSSRPSSPVTPTSSSEKKNAKGFLALLLRRMGLDARVAGSKWPAAGAAVFLLLALVLTGPFMDHRVWRSSFAHHYDFLTKGALRPTLLPQNVPGIYNELAASKERGAVLEYPWAAGWHVNRAFFLYQGLHRREVVVGAVSVLLADRRLAFRNMAPGTPRGFLNSRARWLVVHRDLVKEENGIPPPQRMERRFGFVLPTSARRTIEQLTRKWGEPDESDQRVAVWDLDRVRKETPPAARGKAPPTGFEPVLPP